MCSTTYVLIHSMLDGRAIILLVVLVVVMVVGWIKGGRID